MTRHQRDLMHLARIADAAWSAATYPVVAVIFAVDRAIAGLRQP